MTDSRPIPRLVVVVLCAAVLCLPVTADTPNRVASAHSATQAIYLPIVMRTYADILRLDGYTLNPPHPKVMNGQAFTVLYHISNRSSQTQTIYLIAQARNPQGVLTLLETSVGSGVHAVAVAVTPGSGWYDRPVVAPPYWPAGPYSLVWIVSSTPFLNGQVASAYEPDAFDVLGPYP